MAVMLALLYGTSGNIGAITSNARLDLSDHSRCTDSLPPFRPSRLPGNFIRNRGEYMKALSKLALVIATIVMLSPSAPAATLPSTTVTGMAASNLGPTVNGHRRHRRRRKHPRIAASNAA
jgi:hypothetical protein